MRSLRSVPILIRLLTPDGFQDLAEAIYGRSSSIFYEKRDMVSFMHCHGMLMFKSIRKKRFDSIPYHTSMIYSWGNSLAQKLGVNIGDELWRRFPGVCPYCCSAPCLGDPCKQGKARRKRLIPRNGGRPHYLQGFQEMFGRIYPYNRKTLWIAVSHLNEEIGELEEALRLFTGRHNIKDVEKMALELTDVFTTLFAVANALDFDLAVEMEMWFKDGCPTCHEPQCQCGFIIIDNGVPVGRKIDFAKRVII